MKNLLAVLCLFITSFTMGQLNKKGTIHFGLSGGLQAGIANTVIDNKKQRKTEHSGGFGGGGNVALRMQYGFVKRFSAGLYARYDFDYFPSNNSNTEDYSTYSTSTAYFEDFTLKVNAMVVGGEFKYYPICKDAFALYVAAKVGYSTGKTQFSSTDYSTYVVHFDGKENGEEKGVNFGVNAGINKYWNKYIGWSADLGLDFSFLNGNFSNSNFARYYPYKVKTFGLIAQVGIVTKIGGVK